MIMISNYAMQNVSKQRLWLESYAVTGNQWKNFNDILRNLPRAARRTLPHCFPSSEFCRSLLNQTAALTQSNYLDLWECRSIFSVGKIRFNTVGKLCWNNREILIRKWSRCAQIRLSFTNFLMIFFLYQYHSLIIIVIHRYHNDVQYQNFIHSMIFNFWACVVLVHILYLLK